MAKPGKAVLVIGAGDATGGAIARRFARELLDDMRARAALPVRAVGAARALATAIVAALAVSGCAHRAAYGPNPLPAGELAAARDQVRGYARTYCGSCHIASLPTARPAALAIYNLDRDDWATMLTEERLRNGFPRRLNARLDAPGREQLRRFIEAELALRTAR